MATQDGFIEATLRVLYTINTSPQYILAKSFEKYKVNVVNLGAASGSNGSSSYGRVPLRPCVSAIYRSSPEVQPTGMRDYSLYVLDPLEDIMSRNARGSSDGVAVGMGLLSSVMSSEESNSAMVTGTVIKCAPDELALEVVISLRQIVTQPTEQSYPNHQQFYGEMPYNPHEAYLRSMGMLGSAMPGSDPSYHYPYAAPQAPKQKATTLDHTRAAQFPTPYIGPPKRAPGRPSGRPSRRKQDVTPVVEQAASPTILPTPPMSEAPMPSQPEASDAAVTQDVSMGESGDKSSVSPAPESEKPSQAAVDQVLAALSKLSSIAPSESGTQGDSQGNPALLQLLTAYIGTLQPDTAQLALKAIDPSVSTSHETQAAVSSAIPTNEATIAETSSMNKENLKPQRQPSASTPISMDEKRRLLGASGSSARRHATLSSSPRHSRVVSSSGSRTSVKRASRDADAVESLRNIKKRRTDEQPQNSIAKSSVAMASSPTPTAPNPLQNSQGYQINTGWGGLRMRADGSFSGGHPLRPAHATVQASTSKVVSFFRSANTDANAGATQVRKGPYVIPQWARDVPPPARPTVPQEAKETKTRKKRTGTTRKGTDARKSDVATTTGNCARPEVVVAPVPPYTKSSTPVAPFVARADMPPIIAQSSPIARPRRNNFAFFATSPCRPPANVNRAHPETPMQGRSLFGSPASVKSSRVDGSLFTPSPTHKTPAAGSIAASVHVRLPPASPSPTNRKHITIGSAADLGRSLSIDTKPVEDDEDMYQDDSEGPASSLPIASDDDVMDDDNDITVSNFSLALINGNGGRKDWSSLALPPSSPLPSSSSPLMSTDDLADESACESIGVDPTPDSSQNNADREWDGGNGKTISQPVADTDAIHDKVDSLLGLFDMTPTNSDPHTGDGTINDLALDWQLQNELWSTEGCPQFDINMLLQNDGTFGFTGFDGAEPSAPVPAANMGDGNGMDESLFSKLIFDEFMSLSSEA